VRTMSREVYRHTQVAWVILGSIAIPMVLFALVGIAMEVVIIAVAAAVIVLLVATLFGTLSVGVTESELRFHFGVGFLRRSIPLAQIAEVQQVRTRWYHGWGIHFYPGGTLYNVSGFDALEIGLVDGTTLRLGSDDPQGLLTALRPRIITAQPLSPRVREQGKRRARRRWLWVLVIPVVSVAGIGVVAYQEEKEPRFTLEPQSFRVDSFMYGQQMALADLEELELIEHLPPIRMRTNGYGGGRTLRGHFRLDELGDGQLFIEYGSPPYILARTSNDYVIFNFYDPDETRAVYEKLRHASATVPRAH
jgi:hypothetical protein